MTDAGKERFSRLEVALLTSRGRSAVACVGVRGLGAWELFRARWSRKDGEKDRDFDTWSPECAARPYFGLFRFEELGGASDEIVLRRRTSNSFEIDGHGGEAASSRIVSYFVARGAVEVSADDWDRAVALEEQGLDELSFSRKLSSRVERLFYAESDALVARASTERAAKIAARQRLAWRRFFSELKSELSAPQPDRAELLARIDVALRGERMGRKLLEPIVVALIGAPNAGKSSLLNAILGYDRAVVSATSGTTRDLVSADLVVDGWRFRIVDAAGLRATEDAIERAGTSLAAESALRADLALVVYDRTKSREEQDGVFADFFNEFAQQIASKSILVLNKIDLPDSEQDRSWDGADPTILRVSAKTCAGVETLTKASARAALGEFVDSEDGLAVWTSEQTNYLKELRDLCAQGEHAAANAALLT